MIIAILSDIHGNISALEAVHEDFVSNYNVDAVALLGDIIDYGQHSNEAVAYLREMKDSAGKIMPVICNIFGNHEYAICNGADDPRFSSDRTRACAAHTKEMLNEASWDYIKSSMEEEGRESFTAGGKRFLAVHGSLDDFCWGSITPSISHGLNTSQENSALEAYGAYDIVLSGHSHVPHYFEGYIKADDERFRNKKRIIFINPGSVGQPRNRCPLAQYAVYDTDTEQCDFRKVPYDIEFEMAAFDGSVDDFYRERLALGI